MRRLAIAVAAVFAVLVLAPVAEAGPSAATVASDLEFARSQLRATAETIDPTAYPFRTAPSGAWETRTASWWTSGFFPGSLWLAYQDTGDPSWRTRAERFQAGLESQKDNTSTHDLGFMLFNSFGNGYRLTGVEAYRQVVLEAAESLASRFSPVVGMTRSWGNSSSPTFTVIVDNMMNLELLFWAAKNGGNPAWAAMATSHALKTMEHFVRPDGSTYHVVDFDPATGAVVEKRTHQGLADESTWSRGQAWAVHGFTLAYRETADPRFLITARRLADHFLSRLPPDKVPPWDFDATGPGEPRDSSAAAIAASGLLELARLEPDMSRAAGYIGAAGGILDSLSASYLARSTSSRAILLHGTANKPENDFDKGYSFGDYYFVEALLRWNAQTGGGATSLSAPKLRIRLPRGARNLRRLLRRGAPVKVYADTAGRAIVGLSIKRKTARRFGLAAKSTRVRLARRRRSLARPGWAKVRLRPSRRAARRLRPARRLATRLSVTFVATDGRRATARKAVTFRRRAR